VRLSSDYNRHRGPSMTRARRRGMDVARRFCAM
jgi:hypothetical protein